MLGYYIISYYIISEISKYYPEITIQLELETVLGIEVTRERTNKTITLKQEGSIHNCLNAHYLDCKITQQRVIANASSYVEGGCSAK